MKILCRPLKGVLKHEKNEDQKEVHFTLIISKSVFGSQSFPSDK